VLLVIGLIILVFVLIIGSAMIPHFWLLSGSILLGIMVLIAIHDLGLRRVPSPPLRRLSDLHATNELNTTDLNKAPDLSDKTGSNAMDLDEQPDTTDKTESKAQDWFIYPESTNKKESNSEDC